MTANHSIDPAQFLSEHLEHAEPDLLRAMLKTFIDVLMGAEADALCGAPYGARSDDRVNFRNGYRAYGRARVGFMLEHREIARAALDGSRPIPAGSERALSRVHIRMLLGQLHLSTADLNVLAFELTAALEGPLLLYLSASDLTEASVQLEERIAQGWQDLVQRVCRA